MILFYLALTFKKVLNQLRKEIFEMMFSDKLIEQIRAAFPRAKTDFNGRKRAFFDNGTATLVVGKAAKAEAEARINWSANVGGIFDESKQAEAIIQEGRQAVSDFINAPSPATIV